MFMCLLDGAYFGNLSCIKILGYIAHQASVVIDINKREGKPSRFVNNVTSLKAIFYGTDCSSAPGRR